MSLNVQSDLRKELKDLYTAVGTPKLVDVPPLRFLMVDGQGDPAAPAFAQAMQALFGGPAPRSQVESQILRDAGADRADPGARSVAGDPNTAVVDKGAATQAIINAPAGTGQEATVSTPQ